jgi:hypothetical protein
MLGVDLSLYTDHQKEVQHRYTTFGIAQCTDILQCYSDVHAYMHVYCAL